MKRIKEPIQKPLLWVVFVVLLLLCVPWYLPQTATHPVIMGFPLWAFLAGLATVAMAGFLSWTLSTQWDIEEHLPDGGLRGEGK